MKKRISIVLIIIICICSLQLFFGCNREINESNVFGTFIEIKLEGVNSYKAEREIRAELSRIENLYSLNVSDSEINKINNSPLNEEIIVSESTVYILKICKDVYDYTNGAFNPAIFPLVKLWGFEPGSFFDNKTIPTDNDINTALSKTNFSDLQINETNNTVRKLSDIKIDFGGIVKGYAVGQCADICKSLSVLGLINIGGNLYCLNESNIGITNPRMSDAPYNGKVAINNTSISTSGDYERFYEIADVRYHHIIGKNGKPANNGIVSVTVISNNTALCDALSTAIFVEGIEKAEDIANHYGVYAIILTQDKKVFTFGENYTYQLKDREYSVQ